MHDAATSHWITEDAVLVVGQLQACQGALLGEESNSIHAAIPARVREFTAGRTIARKGIVDLGVAACQIPEGQGGEPLWPNGLCGSISHTGTVAVALVARRSAYTSVGIDVDDERLIGDLASEDVTWPDEVELVRALHFAVDTPAAQNFIFSAKEAIFKCQYPVTGYRGLGFHHVRLIEGPRAGTLSLQGQGVDSSVADVLRHIQVAPLNTGSRRIVGAFLEIKK